MRQDLSNAPIMAVTRWRSNAELIRDVARLGHIRDDLYSIDPTFGRGAWHRLWTPTNLVKVAMEPGFEHLGDVAANFLHLPFTNDTFEQGFWDPAYIVKGGKQTSTMQDHQARYGLIDGPTTPRGVREQWADGLAELGRVCRQGAIVCAKAQNYVSSGKVQWGLDWANADAAAMGFTKVDEFIMVNSGSAQDANRTKRCPTCRGETPEICSGACHGTGRVPTVQHHARRNCSVLLVLRVPAKILDRPSTGG